MEELDVKVEDEIEWEKVSKLCLCDILIPFLMFLWLNFDDPCSSFHQKFDQSSKPLEPTSSYKSLNFKDLKPINFVNFLIQKIKIKTERLYKILKTQLP